MAIGDKLRQARLERGITQDQIADKMGLVNNSYISQVENNIKHPSLEKLNEWGDVLGLTQEELEDLILEAKLEEIGIGDPVFTVMFKDIPKMSAEEKRSIIRAYEAVRKAREQRARNKPKEEE